MTTKSGVTINLARLTVFLAAAVPKGYASGAEGTDDPLGTGFTLFSYPPDGYMEDAEFEFVYEDRYIGFFQAPGQEVVYFKGLIPVWARAYYGGMQSGYQKDEEFAKRTFDFLLRALQTFAPQYPFRRGPEKYTEEEWEYYSRVSGDIRRFDAEEWILYRGERVFWQRYGGGLVLEEGTKVIEG